MSLTLTVSTTPPTGAYAGANAPLLASCSDVAVATRLPTITHVVHVTVRLEEHLVIQQGSGLKVIRSLLTALLGGLCLNLKIISLDQGTSQQNPKNKKQKTATGASSMAAPAQAHEEHIPRRHQCTQTPAHRPELCRCYRITARRGPQINRSTAMRPCPQRRHTPPS